MSMLSGMSEEMMEEVTLEGNVYSVIVTVDSGENVNELLDTIFRDEMAAKIEVILALYDVDIIEVKKYIREEYIRKICYVYTRSAEPADIYQAAKEIISGAYICFINERMYYSENTFHFVYEKIKETRQKIISVCPVFDDTALGVSEKYPVSPNSSGLIQMKNMSNAFQLFFPAYFFKRELVEKIGFDRKISAEQEQNFLLECYMKCGEYLYLMEKELYFRDAAENEFSTNLIQYRKEWYLDDTKNFLLKWAEQPEYLESENKKVVQNYILYLLYARYNCNSNDRNKKILDDDELEQFIAYSKAILRYIPEDCILSKKRLFTIPRQLKILFIKLKYAEMGYSYRLLEDGDGLFLQAISDSHVGQIYRITGLKNEKVVVTAINYENDVLKIDFKSNLVDVLDVDDIHIKVVYGSKEAELTEVECYPLIKSFGKTVLRRKQYQATIPILEGNFNIKFYFELNGKCFPQVISYGNAAARLSNHYKKCYWNFTDDYVMFHNGVKREIRIRKMTKWRRIGRELNFISEIRKVQKTDDYKEMCRLRFKYLMRKKDFENKRIWITFDKLYKGGDNGEYMYHYLKAHDLGITPYYVINEDAPDYARLKASGENILIANSRECREMCLFAEAILATHTTIWNYCGFTKAQQEYVRDLLNAKIICIQHGLTVQKIAQYQNRLFDNTRFYCCASRYEIDNILKPIYGYSEQDVVLTGLARYDGLKNNDKKQILITPTWRRDIVNNGIACRKKTHNAHFKDSTYYKVYNNLINNKKLIDTARETGYQIIYLLHPAMSSQSVDFVRNDYVQIMEATGDMSYEKILTESSLMVTDYSGVQFDFAYMRKPVVYYHPDALPPFYEDGVFQYDTMGFGEICRQEEELIDTLCGYMKNGCQCSEYYISRADNFFAFDDYNSCERIYHAIENFLKRD